MAARNAGVLIVGGGLASARAVKSYREAGGEGPVTLLSADSRVPYHRPPLSKRFLRGEAEAEDALVESETFYREQGVEVRLETRAASLDTRGRAVVLEDGDRVPFDQLLIASGATPRRLEVPGAELDDVFTLRTLDDSARIREAARAARQAVVVGAGFIGMEVAASLTQLDVEVTLIHRGQGLFEALRARRLEVFLGELYGRNGVEIVLGDEVSAFGGRSRVDSVTTLRGRTAQADLAVVGIGVRPSTDWLEGSGLRLEDGVVVNERYETGIEGIWAVGDVARFYDPLFGRHRRIEHWSNANYQGTQVGELIAGKDNGGYDVVSTFFSEVFGRSFKVFGDVDEFDELVLRGSIEDDDAIGCYLADGRLCGCLVFGQDEQTEDELKALIRERTTVEDIDQLADESSSLADVFSRAGA